jgi:hypothetical protein
LEKDTHARGLATRIRTQGFRIDRLGGGLVIHYNGADRRQVGVMVRPSAVGYLPGAHVSDEGTYGEVIDGCLNAVVNCIGW